MIFKEESLLSVRKIVSKHVSMSCYQCIEREKNTKLTC